MFKGFHDPQLYLKFTSVTQCGGCGVWQVRREVRRVRETGWRRRCVGASRLQA